MKRKKEIVLFQIVMITHPILRKHLYGQQKQLPEEKDEEVLSQAEKNEIKEGSEEADDEGEKDMKVWRKKQKKKKRSSTGSPSPCSSSEDEDEESFVKKNKFWLQRR